MLRRCASLAALARASPSSKRVLRTLFGSFSDLLRRSGPLRGHLTARRQRAWWLTRSATVAPAVPPAREPDKGSLSFFALLKKRSSHPLCVLSTPAGARRAPHQPSCWCSCFASGCDLCSLRATGMPLCAIPRRHLASLALLAAFACPFGTLSRYAAAHARCALRRRAAPRVTVLRTRARELRSTAGVGLHSRAATSLRSV